VPGAIEYTLECLHGGIHLSDSGVGRYDMIPHDTIRYDGFCIIEGLVHRGDERDTERERESERVRERY
jgi:hypothetical protein